MILLKKPSLLLFFLFLYITVPARSLLPQFNSIVISEEKFDSFDVTCNYYTIDNNISNRKSAVFATDSPQLKDYIKFSRDLPSYFFTFHRGDYVYYTVMLLQGDNPNQHGFNYRVVDAYGRSDLKRCSVNGDITEKRAMELLQLKVDNACALVDLPGNGKGLRFNNMVYNIQSYDRVKEEVIRLIYEYFNIKPVNNDPVIDTLQFIKKESVGGTLDFEKALANEAQSLFIFQGTAYSRKDYAILLWGKKVRSLGINSVIKAMALWEEIYKRKLTEPEKKAFQKGFIFGEK